MRVVTAEWIANKLGGKVVGNPAVELAGIKPLESAGAGELTFLEPTSRRKSAELLGLAQQSSAGAIMVRAYDSSIPVTQIVVPNPLAAVISAAEVFVEPALPALGIHPTAVVDPSAVIGAGVRIGAYCVIGAGVTVGAGTIIHPHVVVYARAAVGENCVIHSFAVIREDLRLGANCLIQNGVVLGGDGFGYTPDPQAGHRLIPHLGTVVLEDNVDVGANSTIDRATFGETRIKEGTKIDNLVMIGHNNTVGRRSLLCGQVGLSGSCTVGDDVVLAGQVGVADHVVIGDKARVAAQSGVAADIPAATDVMGYPSSPIGEYRRQYAALKRLPQLLEVVREHERRLEALTAPIPPAPPGGKAKAQAEAK